MTRADQDAYRGEAPASGYQTRPTGAIAIPWQSVVPGSFPHPLWANFRLVELVVVADRVVSN
jgi:hypothetical protein